MNSNVFCKKLTPSYKLEYAHRRLRQIVEGFILAPTAIYQESAD